METGTLHNARVDGGGCVRCGSFRGLATTPRGLLLCEEHLHRRYTPAAAVLVVYAVAAAAIAAALTETSIPLVVLGVVPALVAVLVVEQVAHVAVAALTGIRTGAITLGIGPRVATVGRRPLVVRLLPVVGEVDGATRGDPASARWRVAWAAYAAAGPAALVAVLLAAVRYPSSPAAVALAVAAAFLLFLDVLRVAPRSGRAASDVWNTVARITRPAPTGVDTPTGWGMTRGELFDEVDTLYAHYRAERWAATAEQAARLRAVIPDDVPLRRIEVLALVNGGRHAEARAAALALLDGDVDDGTRAEADNMLAWVDALSGEHPAEMRRHLDRALAVLPDEPALAGTAALVAAREGRFADGLAECDRAESGLTVAWQRATVTATRAYIAYRQGDRALAERHATEARALDPECVVLDLLPA